MNIRKRIFFFIDRLRGGKVSAQLQDIQRIHKAGEHNEELRRILEYTTAHVHFYESIQSGELRDFPVMNKEMYNRNYNEILNPLFEKAGLHVTSTSGSTGVPFLAYQDSIKRERTIADLMTMFSEYGFETGDRYVFIRSWVKHYKLSAFKKLKQNFIAVDVNSFDDAAKEKLRRQLQDSKKIIAVITYGSALEDFVSYLEKKNDNSSMYHIKVVFSSSDALKDEVKEKTQKILGCTVINRYSNEECGIMGYTDAGSTVFRMNTASYHFELLEMNSDKPAMPGTIGRIVVTDLFNHAMPLIRYDSGDLGVSDDDGSNVTTLKMLVGRVADSLYSENGVLITAATLSTYMQEYKEIIKYQLVCIAKDSLELLLVTDSEDFTEIEQMLKKVFGKSYQITIKKVDSIKNEPNGKYKQIITRCKEQ